MWRLQLFGEMRVTQGPGGVGQICWLNQAQIKHTQHWGVCFPCKRIILSSCWNRFKALNRDEDPALLFSSDLSVHWLQPVCSVGPEGLQNTGKWKESHRFYSQGIFSNYIDKQQPQRNLSLSLFQKQIVLRIWRCVTQVVWSLFQANTLNLSHGQHQREKNQSWSSNYVFLTWPQNKDKTEQISDMSSGAQLSPHGFGCSVCLY